jgi:alpha-tubulin suppressor-like RCC1 family protein
MSNRWKGGFIQAYFDPLTEGPLLNVGPAYTWGDNNTGQIGNSTLADVSSPTQIGSEIWKDVSSGSNHSLAVKNDGTLWGWGKNTLGQLGNNDTTNTSSPIQIGALTTWNKASAGNDVSFAIKTDGTLWAWGDNSPYGYLGVGDKIDYSSPVQIGADTNWEKIYGSKQASAAIKTDGTAWIWGRGSTYGLIGNNQVIDYSSPVQIGADTDWLEVTPGNLSVAAVKTTGELYGWGYNIFGETGLNNQTPYSSPVQVGALTNWANVHTRTEATSTMAIKTDGTLWAWGSNLFGRLGDNTAIYRSSPVQIGSDTNWYTGTCGHVLHAIKTDGTLWCLGSQANQGAGGTGDASFQNSSPVQVGALAIWAKIDTSETTPIALLKS